MFSLSGAEKEPRIVRDELSSEVTVPLIFQSFVELVLGVFLVLYRDKTGDILFIVTGALMVGYGVFDIIAFLTNNRQYSFRQGLMTGVLMTIMGTAVIVQAHKLSDLIAMILGALIIIESIVNCRRMVLIKGVGFEKWYIPFIISLVFIVVGMLICIFPDIFLEVVFIVAGILIILVGLLDLWSMLTIIRLKRHIEKEAEVKERAVVIDETKRGF